MDDPGHPAASRRLQREHGTACALGDEVVLQVLGEGGVAGELAEPFGEPPPALAQLAPQAAERRRGRVAQVGSVFLDGAARSPRRCGRQRLVDPGHELARAPAGRPVPQASAGRRLLPRSCAGRGSAPTASSVPPRSACSAASRTSAAPPRSGSAASSRSAIASAVCRCRSSTTSVVGRGDDRRGANGARLARGRGGEPSEDGGELQQLEIVLAHAASVRPARALKLAPFREVSYDSGPCATGTRCHSCTETFCSPTAAWRRRSSSSRASSSRASPRSPCSRRRRAVPRSTRYYEPYLEVARRHGTGFVVEAPTWRANPAWGEKLGYSLDELADANRRAIGFVADIAEREEEPGRPIVINAPFGPESDAYDPASRMSAEEAEEYHAWQAGVIAGDAGGHGHRAHDHLRRGGDRDRPRRCRPPGCRSRCRSRSRPTVACRPASRSPRRSSRSTPRRTGRRRTSWSTAPTRNTSPPCSTTGTRGTACSASAPTLPTKSHAELDESEELDDGDPPSSRAHTGDRRAAAAPHRARRLLWHGSPPRRLRCRRLARPR